MATEWRAEF
jgi:hypothetical protein